MNQMRDKMRSAFRVEGQDHINISTASTTRLGKLLSPDYRRAFFIPHLGEFASARCFANWLASNGDDKLRNSHDRYNNRSVPANVFRLYMLYAKHFQIFSIRRTFMEQSAQLDLPWVMYRSYVTGVKEFDRWEDYPRLVRVMVEHAINEKNSVKIDWDKKISKSLIQEVNKAVRNISIANGVAEDQIVDLLAADKVQQVLRDEAKQQRKEVHRQKNQVRVVPAMAPAAEKVEDTTVVETQTADDQPQQQVDEPQTQEVVTTQSEAPEAGVENQQ